MDNTQHNSSLVDYTKTRIMTDLKERLSCSRTVFIHTATWLFIYLLFSRQRCQYLGLYASYIHMQMFS